jgi:hypothetical protein
VFLAQTSEQAGSAKAIFMAGKSISGKLNIPQIDQSYLASFDKICS